jgi:predicted nucleic acid-binding protein
MQRVVVDANVFLSVFVERNEKQGAAAKALLLKAEDGEVAVIVPQFVIFEIVYVLESTYRIGREKLKDVIRDLLALPGVLAIDECPWKRILDLWPSPFRSIADAAIVAIAADKRYDAVATFDQTLAKRLKAFSVVPYW